MNRAPMINQNITLLPCGGERRAGGREGGREGGRGGRREGGREGWGRGGRRKFYLGGGIDQMY